MKPEKYTNERGKECYRGVSMRTPLSNLDFHEVEMPKELAYQDFQCALHTNIGSLTVLDRQTGFGWRDIETGYRDENGNFWLASGNVDVRNSGANTFGDAVDFVKKLANTCVPKTPKQRNTKT